MPKPFRRDAIEATFVRQPREWRDVAASEVVEGDLVAGMGLVRHVTHNVDEHAENAVYIFAGDSQAPFIVEPAKTVRAFKVRHDAPAG